MNESIINKYYKVLSLITLIISFAFLFIPNNGQGIFEKIWPTVGLNIGFHLMFQFLSRMPFRFSKFFNKENSKLSKTGNKLMNSFCIMAMTLAVFGTLGFVTSTIDEGNYERLLMLPIFIAIFLGGYSSLLKIKQLQ